MNLIKPSFFIKEQEPGLQGVYRQIEWVGRHCYKSLDKITEDSAKSFVDRMTHANHLTPLEHGTVYLHIIDGFGGGYYLLKDKYAENPYSKVIKKHNPATGSEHLYITSNYRVLIEQGWLDDLKYICEPIEYHEKRTTVHFILDRSTANEFVRHRVFSFMQESQRYCNYSADKFGNEIAFIKPCWLDDEKLKLYGPYHTVIRDKSPESIFIANLNNAERDYLDLISLGWKPQEARAVLPNACKTELIMTGTIEQWTGFFKLRTALNAHPSARELAIPLREEFIKRGYINE